MVPGPSLPRPPLHLTCVGPGAVLQRLTEELHEPAEGELVDMAHQTHVHEDEEEGGDAGHKVLWEGGGGGEGGRSVEIEIRTGVYVTWVRMKKTKVEEARPLPPLCSCLVPGYLPGTRPSPPAQSAP